jgi:glyoxylase-like metal-dependent hydrolase (beta-lactamase superfamily II)
MHRYALWGVALFVWLARPAAAQQQNFDAVVIKPYPVNGNIHMLEGAGGNIGVSVGPDGILIVDDQFAPLADKIKTALRGLGAGSLKFVLNTHFHGDHTGGNPIFGREATIVAHANVRKRVSTEQRRGDQIIPPIPREGWPVITFDEAVSVHFNGEEIRLMHMPNSHTDTDAIIFFTASNVVHMGDTFFNGRFPFVDLGSGGTVDGLIRTIGTVLSQIGPDTKIIPGHGPLATKEDLKTYHGMLVETTDYVRGMMVKGMALEEVKKAGFPDRWKDWGSGFISADRWIETIYTSYGKR